MSKINKWYSDSKSKLEDEIWPKLGPEGCKSKVKDVQTQTEQVVQATSSLDHSEYPKLGEKIKGESIGKFAKTKEVKLYYNSGNIMQKTRSRKIRSTDPITLNLQHIINNSAASLPKQKSLSKKNSKSESPIKSKRKVRISKVKLPSTIKKAILWEREMKRSRANKELTEIKLDKLKIDVEAKPEEDITRNLSQLNIFGQDYRQSLPASINDDTVESRPDLIEGLEKLKVGPKTIKRNNCIEFSFNRISTNESILNEEDFNRSLSLTEGEDSGTEGIRFSRKFREYCTNLVTPGLTLSLDTFLTEIKRLQKKLYERDDVKGRCKRRLYAGFKEVEKYVLVNKIKFIIIATDIDKIMENGILDKTVEKFTEICTKHDVAICYGLVRHKLGYFVHGKGITSVIGIANYHGADEKLEVVLKELVEARNEFNRLSGKHEKIIDMKKVSGINSFLISERINSLLKVISSVM